MQASFKFVNKTTCAFMCLVQETTITWLTGTKWSIAQQSWQWKTQLSPTKASTVPATWGTPLSTEPGWGSSFEVCSKLTLAQKWSKHRNFYDHSFSCRWVALPPDTSLLFFCKCLRGVKQSNKCLFVVVFLKNLLDVMLFSWTACISLFSCHPNHSVMETDQQCEGLPHPTLQLFCSDIFTLFFYFLSAQPRFTPF